MEQMPLKQKKIGTTIAAISTAQGAGGVGMIRISGEHAREIADRVFISPHGKKLYMQRDIQLYTVMYINRVKKGRNLKF